MTEFALKLAERSAKAGLETSADQMAQLEAYFELLARWSARINLTALPLEGAPDVTIDRLFIEPLAAASYVATSPIRWFDIGSGGGSPAIPLKIVRPSAHLTMVESKGRKAAFLREALRVLELQETDVAEARFEAIAGGSPPGQADLLTIRAVRVEQALTDLCRRTLKTGGRMLLFQSSPVGSVQPQAGFLLSTPVELTDSPSFLHIAQAV